MVDQPLSPVGRVVRWLAILALGVAAPAFAAIAVALAVVPFRRPVGNPVGWAAIVGLMTVLSLTSGWMLVRLVRRRTAANGATTMPWWFVGLSGLGFLGMAGWQVWADGGVFFPAAGCAAVGVTAITTAFRLRQAERPPAEWPDLP